MFEILPDGTPPVAAGEYALRRRWRYWEPFIPGIFFPCEAETSWQLAESDVVLQICVIPSKKAMEILLQTYDTDSDRAAMMAFCTTLAAPASHILSIGKLFDEEIVKHHSLQQRLLQEALLTNDFLAKMCEEIDAFLPSLPEPIADGQQWQKNVRVYSLEPNPEERGYQREYEIKGTLPNLTLTARVILQIRE